MVLPEQPAMDATALEKAGGWQSPARATCWGLWAVVGSALLNTGL